jgi:transposase-like protein
MSTYDPVAGGLSARSGRPKSKIPPLEALTSSPGRVRDIAALRGLGYTYREIAQHYGVTPQAVSLLLSRNRRNMKSIGGKPQLATLSSRATNALRRLGIETREEAIAVQALSKLANTRNCGRKTLDEIEEWLKGNEP